MKSEFQFTHPVWGATYTLVLGSPYSWCFNSRTPCGVRLVRVLLRSLAPKFQFTHPVWGATGVHSSLSPKGMFQFTHPVWGATALQAGAGAEIQVSIHAPRVGCDIQSELKAPKGQRFNSRTPCGVRLWWCDRSGLNTGFNSRTPCGVRPQGGRQAHSGQYVSIHAPRVGCDRSSMRSRAYSTSFNSRTPCGVRLSPRTPPPF